MKTQGKKVKRPCPDCLGTGYVDTGKCPTCKGTGQIEQEILQG